MIFKNSQVKIFIYLILVFTSLSSISQIKAGENSSNSNSNLLANDNCLIPCDRIVELLPKNGIPSIDKPKYMSVNEVINDDYLKDTSKVLGIVINDIAFAYPYNILNFHEIVNDNIEGLDLSITYCPLTGSGIAFQRSKIHNTTFGVSGSLYENNLIMYDRGTDSLWSQMLGTSIKGENIGKTVETALTIETTWRAWKSLYPGSLILSRYTGIYDSRSYERQPYLGYDQTYSIRFKTSYNINTYPNNLYEPKAKTMIISIGNETMILPFVELSGFSVINEVISSTPIVVVTDPFNDLSLVYSPVLPDGTVLENFIQSSFYNMDPVNTFNLPVFTDSSETIWNMKGKAIQGKYIGVQLIRLPSYNAYWFAAIVFYPDARIYPLNASSSPIENTIDLFNNRPGDQIESVKSIGISFIVILPIAIFVTNYIYRKKNR